MPWILYQATLNAIATQIAPPSTAQGQVQARQVLIQNNAAHSMRVGDSTVSSTKGIYLAAGPGGGTFNTGPASPVYNSYAGDFWAFGTAGDVVDMFVNT